jgi:hypothetical protein
MLKHKGSILLILCILLFWSCFSMYDLVRPKSVGSEEINQTHSTNSATDRDLPNCDDTNLSREEVEAAFTKAMVGLDNAWGKDFQLVFERVEIELNCTFQTSSPAPPKVLKIENAGGAKLTMGQSPNAQTVGETK